MRCGCPRSVQGGSQAQGAFSMLPHGSIWQSYWDGVLGWYRCPIQSRGWPTGCDPINPELNPVVHDLSACEPKRFMFSASAEELLALTCAHNAMHCEAQKTLALRGGHSLFAVNVDWINEALLPIPAGTRGGCGDASDVGRRCANMTGYYRTHWTSRPDRVRIRADGANISYA